MPSAVLNIILAVVTCSAGLLFSSFQGEVDTGSYVAGLVFKLIVRDVYPTMDNQTAGLAKVRGLMNGQQHPPVLADPKIMDVTIVTSADKNMLLRVYLQEGGELNQNKIGDTPQTEKLLPVLIWFHGGGFVVGNFSNDDSQCKRIVKHTDFVVVSVDYRLAPENKFPAAILDAIDALQWTKQSIQEYGGDPNLVYLSGESAGGTIAAALTAVTLDPSWTNPATAINIKGLFLVYPCLDHGVYLDSHFRYSNSFALLTLKQMQYFWSLYLNDQAIDSLDYRACPMRTPDSILQHFPKTYIILAKNDILLDEGLKFAERLKSVNVSAETTVYNDVYHGFFSMGAGGKVRDVEICKNLQALTL